MFAAVTGIEETPAAAGQNAAAPSESAAAAPPRYGRAVLVLTGVASLIGAALGPTVFAFAGGSDSAHTPAVYLLAQSSHDIGHNDWAFQGGPSGRIGWVATYAALGLGWLISVLWTWAAGRRAGHRAPWLRILIPAWSVMAVSGVLTMGIAYYAESTSTVLGPLALRFSDLCSPWWSCAAVLAALAVRERDRRLAWGVSAYTVLLAAFLLLPIPGPDLIKALLLTVAVAAPTLWARQPAAGRTGSPSPERSADPARPAGSAPATS